MTYATARCRTQAEADNRVGLSRRSLGRSRKPKAKTGHFGTTGLPVGLHAITSEAGFHRLTFRLDNDYKREMVLISVYIK
jgi:hypothetical protein